MTESSDSIFRNVKGPSSPYTPMVPSTAVLSLSLLLLLLPPSHHASLVPCPPTTPGLASKAATTIAAEASPVSLSLHNKAGRPVELFWLDPDGREVFQALLPPGKTLTQTVRAAHAFRVRRSARLASEGGAADNLLLLEVRPSLLVVPAAGAVAAEHPPQPHASCKSASRGTPCGPDSEASAVAPVYVLRGVEAHTVDDCVPLHFNRGLARGEDDGGGTAFDRLPPSRIGTSSSDGGESERENGEYAGGRGEPGGNDGNKLTGSEREAAGDAQNKPGEGGDAQEANGGQRQGRGWHGEQTNPSPAESPHSPSIPTKPGLNRRSAPNHPRRDDVAGNDLSSQLPVELGPGDGAWWETGLGAGLFQPQNVFTGLTTPHGCKTLGASAASAAAAATEPTASYRKLTTTCNAALRDLRRARRADPGAWPRSHICPTKLAPFLGAFSDNDSATLTQAARARGHTLVGTQTTRNNIGSGQRLSRNAFAENLVGQAVDLAILNDITDIAVSTAVVVHAGLTLKQAKDEVLMLLWRLRKNAASSPLHPTLHATPMCVHDAYY